MLINFNHLKTFWNALAQKLKSYRGNWEQNDPTADDYIKNRPFYSEGVQEVTVLSKKTVNVGVSYNEIYDPFSIRLVAGKTYKVSFDGVEYETVAKEPYNNELYIGNDSILGWYGGRNTGEPFFIMVYTSGSYSEVVFASTKSGDHTISVSMDEEIIHKIDKKFVPIPDGIVTGESLPTILEDNLAPVAFTNSYSSLSGKPTIYTDVVRYTTTQSLTDAQKTVARNNIGAASASDVTTLSNDVTTLTNSAVQYAVSQSLTEAQKEQARANIGVSNFSGSYNDLADKPDLAIVASTGSYQDLLDKPNYAVLNDVANSYDYIVQLNNGALVTICKCARIEITTMPAETEYVAGEVPDLTDLIITVVRQDGTMENTENYTCLYIYNDTSTTVVLQYYEFGEIYETSFTFSVSPFDPSVQLIDFDYIDNGNGTYTLTGWKQTLNGEASTEMIVPNNSFIIL